MAIIGGDSFTTIAISSVQKAAAGLVASLAMSTEVETTLAPL
jgi:hypothetical protein